MKPLAAALKVWMDRIDSVVIMTREDAPRRLNDGGRGAHAGEGRGRSAI